MTAAAFAALAESAGLCPLDLDDGAFERLTGYFERRAQWGRVHNLSGPATLRDPWQTDALDGLAVAQCMADAPLVDVGTGNGVPGFLVACLRPDLRVELVEPRVKRVAFLRATSTALGLSALRLHRARWPVPVQAPYQIVSRAVVSPSDWPHLAVEGQPPAAVLRMLADDRPDFPLDGWRLAQGVDYTSMGRSLRVERWAPTVA